MSLDSPASYEMLVRQFVLLFSVADFFTYAVATATKKERNYSGYTS